MLEGLLGKKIGMTHLFGAESRVVPVTVLEIGPCVVTQVRTTERDGYEAVQVGFGEAKQLNRPASGHQKAAGSTKRRLREFKAIDEVPTVGEAITVGQFQPGDMVDVTANTKGRGFQGVVRRHGYAGGPKTHGQSDRQRAPGSAGPGTFPGRVLKGKAMPGHMGNEQVTIRHLVVEQVDIERNLLMVRGGVPGARSGHVTVRYSRGVPIAERVAPVVEEPEVEAEIEETPATETAAAPVAEAPADEPAAEAEAPADEPAVEEETSEEPPAPAEEAPAGEETPADEPAGEETPVEDAAEEEKS